MTFRLLLRLACAAAIVALMPMHVQAAIFNVTKTADTNDGTCNADCSLREAIAAANAGAWMWASLLRVCTSIVILPFLLAILLFPTTSSADTVRDEFNTIASYTGNDGTANWSNDWQELGESDGPGAGEVEVLLDARCAAVNCLRIGGNNVNINGRGASRQADLSAAASATLTFSYRRKVAGGGGGSINLDVWDNDLSTWDTLQTYQLNGNDGSNVPQNFDISAYMFANSQIRFIGTGASVRSQFFIDNVEIDYTLSGAILLVLKSSSTVRDPLGAVAPNAHAIPGAVAEYPISISNSGSDAAENVIVTDTLDANLSFLAGEYNAGASDIEIVVGAAAAVYCIAEVGGDSNADGCFLNGAGDFLTVSIPVSGSYPTGLTVGTTAPNDVATVRFRTTIN